MWALRLDKLIDLALNSCQEKTISTKYSKML